jgi:hypothetical protein
MKLESEQRKFTKEFKLEAVRLLAVGRKSGGDGAAGSGNRQPTAASSPADGRRGEPGLAA